MILSLHHLCIFSYFLGTSGEVVNRRLGHALRALHACFPCWVPRCSSILDLYSLDKYQYLVYETDIIFTPFNLFLRGRTREDIMTGFIVASKKSSVLV